MTMIFLTGKCSLKEYWINKYHEPRPAHDCDTCGLIVPEENYDLFTWPRKLLKIICVSAFFRTENHQNRLCFVPGAEVLDALLSIYTETDLVNVFLDDNADLYIFVEEFMKLNDTDDPINVI